MSMVREYTCGQCSRPILVPGSAYTTILYGDNQETAIICVECMKQAFRIFDDDELDKRLFSDEQMTMRIPDPDPLNPDINGVTIVPRRSKTHDEAEISRVVDRLGIDDNGRLSE